jgi:hypothetical protein
MTQEQLEVQGFGIRAKVFGADLKSIIILIIVAAILGFMIWNHDTKEHNMMIDVIEELAALTYVTSLTPEERKHLQLTMPESLRKKITLVR